MTTTLATMLKISTDRISIKATTNEKLGFIGRGEGIAAEAIATIRLPFASIRQQAAATQETDLNNQEAA